ncbi:formate dehydrogenase subunit delta [Pseudaminobacter sp. 19-2017]|uniref:Formate dehydrogenase subunit delta n=1 Tax=Pseudaminobacter soli (ex Zhang et al. 2022) TaxID=2831468 RepID=A0A942I6G9_9HYPH|nr:formate dehydrogenase subunit delta [Pseudaminobacter soli]MBS3647300.1 formate dehydrogenase subunit delta [Pseudaminobacter soli]
MSHDEDHSFSAKEKLAYMANQIATFFRSKPRDEGVAGVADHINKFWEPRMRRQFFEMIDAGGKGFDELVTAAAPKVRRPKPEPTSFE